MLNKNCLNNKINEININDFCEELIQELQKNELVIKAVNDIDKKYYDKIVDIIDFVKIIEEYKMQTQKKEYKNILCIYNGNPEITLRLCLEAIVFRTNFILGIQDFMVGINTYLIEIINKLLEKYSSKIYLFNLLKIEQIKKVENDLDKILCIGNTKEFLKLSEKGFVKLDFYPYKSLNLYCEDEKFEKLQQMIYDYSMINEYEIEIYSNDSINNIIRQINEFGNGYCSVLLSENKEHIDKFKNEVKSEYVCVNENPYSKIKFEINKYI